MEGRTGSLSSPLGAHTTSGLRKLRLIWRLRRWKYCAGVVGYTTCMFTFGDVLGSYGSFVS